MNDFFVNSGASALINNPASNMDPLTTVPDLKETCSMFVRPSTLSEIVNVMSNLKDSSAGSDRLKPKVIREVRHEIAKPVLHLVNLSLSKGIFPDLLKEAVVTPIYKKGAKDLMSNYRPVSILKVFAKIIEKVMYSRLSDYVNAANILYDRQFGFRSGHSTEMAVAEITSTIYRELNERRCVMAINMDLSKAFDTINHEILLQKLDKCGIGGLAYSWIRSYLSNRTQRVRHYDTISDARLIAQRVPQGSNLGPLLFSLYVNDFHRLNNNCKIIQYADDSNILFAFNRNDLTVTNKINAFLSLFSDWFSSNDLSLNASKTNYLIFSGRKKMTLDGIFINGEQIKQVSHANFLGIVIDDALTWKPHIQSIHGKLSKSLGILRKVSKSLSRSIMMTLFNSFVMSYLRYGLTIWGAAPKSNLNSLYILQKKAIKIALQMQLRTPTISVFRAAKVLTLPNLYKFQLSIFMYKYKSELLPPCFNGYFEHNSSRHNYLTRSGCLYRLPLFTTTYCQQSIQFQGAKIWSTISEQIRSRPSTASFKRALRVELLHQQSVAVD